MAEQDIRRQTAYICTISMLHKGTFVKKQGWESNYLMTEYGDFSRVNIIAAIVAEDNNTLTIDDGTGQIGGRMFENTDQLSQVSVGDIVRVIARPREFNESIYLTLEIVKKCDAAWIAYRKKELSLIKKIRELEDTPKSQTKPQEAEIVESTSTLGYKERIAKLIKDLDRGEGAVIDDVLKISRINNGEEIISDMMMRGEIYEVKAGHVKLM